MNSEEKERMSSSPERISSTQTEETEEVEEVAKEDGRKEKMSASASSPAQGQVSSGVTTSVSIAVSTEDLLAEEDAATRNHEQQNQPSSSSGNRSDGVTSREAATKGPRVCGVCGDKAKSMHFGGLSCDSCKAFFRRAVHNDAYLNFSCPYDGNCVMNITSRKCCQFCRYKKCTAIGMERAWVMSEEERAQMMKQREERKTKQGGGSGGAGVGAGRAAGGCGGGGGAAPAAAPAADLQNLKNAKREMQPYEPDIGTMLDYMAVAERDEIERAILNYRRAYNEVPYRNDLKDFNVGRPSVQIINMFTTVVRRFAYFARLFPEFCNLPKQDQGTLLRGGILEMSLIRGVQSYDTEHNRWPNTNHKLYKDAPTLRIEDMKKLVSGELYEMHMKFIRSTKELNVDEPVMMLLLLTVLFTSDRSGLQAAQVIQAQQDHYLHLMRKYMDWRYGPNNSSLLYPKLLLKLTDLRELNDQHTEYNLKLAKQEVAEIQLQLGRLNLNPYTEWPTIMQMQQSDSSGQPSPSSSQSSSLKELQQVFGCAKSPTATSPTSLSPMNIVSDTGIGGGPSSTSESSATSGMPGSSQSGAPSASSFDFDQLANHPRFQRMIMEQFQKSIMNVLSSPNFGLGNMFPDGRNPQQPTGSCTSSQQQQQQQQQQLQQEQDQQRQQEHQEMQFQPTSHGMQQQQQPKTPQHQHKDSPGHILDPTHGVSLTQPPIDLMAQIDHLESSQSNPLQTSQQSHAFQQLERQLMSNINPYGGFVDPNQQLPQNYNLNQQQYLHQQLILQQQQQQQHIPHQHPFYQEQQSHHQQSLPQPMMVVPKQEPATPPPGGQSFQYYQQQHQSLHAMSQDLMQQDHQSSPPMQSSPVLLRPPHQQTQLDDQEEPGSRPKRNSLTDASGLSQFRNLLEEFATLNDPSQLEQVKHILGPDLVASLQQKLVGANLPSSPPQPSHFQQQLPSAQHQSMVTSHLGSTSQVHMQHQSPVSQFCPMEGDMQYYVSGGYPVQQTGDSTLLPSTSGYSPTVPGHTMSSPSHSTPANATAFCRTQQRSTPPIMMTNTPHMSTMPYNSPENNAVMFQYPDVTNVTTSN